MSHAETAARYCAACGGALAPRRVEAKVRPACTKCDRIVFDDPKVAVVAIVTRSEELLLVQRRRNPARGKWVLPGGFLDAGEDPRDVAVREVREETGLDIARGDILDGWAEPPAPGAASLVLLVRAALIGGTLAAADDAADAGFFALDALPELAFQSTARAVALLRA